MKSRPGSSRDPNYRSLATNHSSEERESVNLILAVGRSFKFVDDYVRPRMAKLGLTMTEFSILSTLYHGGPIPLGELSDRILLTGATTTYTVKKLEQRGLLLRRSKDEDRRVVLGAISGKGKKLLSQIFPLHAKHLSEAMSGLTLQEKRTISNLLLKMRTVRS